MPLEKLQNKIIENTLNDVYCRLRPSIIHEGGVGIFAIRDIPKDTNPFKVAIRTPAYMLINKNELKNAPEPIQEMVSDFSFLNENNEYAMLLNGLNSLPLEWYLNHSDTPNILRRFYEDDDYVIYIAARDIKVDEELSFNYRHEVMPFDKTFSFDKL